MNAFKSVAVERGCGTRARGGCYLESGLGVGGLPIEHFLIDEPMLLDVARLGIAPIGVKLIKRFDAALGREVTHVFDWVGSENYPCVADYVEETRRFGASRRVPRTIDFSQLTADSRLILIHSRAWVANFDEYAAAWQYADAPTSDRPFPRCPKQLARHELAEAPANCVGVYWQDLDSGVPTSPGSRAVTRTLPSFSYSGFTRPVGVTGNYRPAAFMALAITRIVAIRDRDETDSANLKAIGRSSLPGELENE